MGIKRKITLICDKGKTEELIAEEFGEHVYIAAMDRNRSVYITFMVRPCDAREFAEHLMKVADNVASQKCRP